MVGRPPTKGAVMPYSVILMLKSGRVIGEFEVFNLPTPKVGDTIELEHEGRLLKSRVTGIGRTPARTPTARTTDIVHAIES